MKVTYEEVRTHLHYDPKNGEFTWIKPTGKKTKVGNIAGKILESGHIMITMNGKSEYAHRLAWLYMTGDLPEGAEVFHRDQVANNNRWNNLFCGTRSQGLALRKLPDANNTSGVRGVYLDRSTSKWVAEMRVDGKLHRFGRFNKIEDAAKARKRGVKELLGV